MMRFQFSYDAEQVCLTAMPEKTGGLLRFFKKSAPVSLKDLSREDQQLLFAIADLRALGEELGLPPQISDTQIIMSHDMLARVDSQTAAALELPPLPEFTLKTDTSGELGKPSFQLDYKWLYKQQEQAASRAGAVLKTHLGVRRLPYFIKDALDIADSPYKDGSLEGDWEALARFRHALEPNSAAPVDDAEGGSEEETEERREYAAEANRIEMGKFFKGLKINLADSFSIAQARNGDKTDFEVVPFSKRKLAQNLGDDKIPAEKDSELGDFALEVFQSRLRARGALPAFQIERGHYLVIDRSAAPVLRLMAEKQRAAPAERAEFAANPAPALRQLAEEQLRESCALQGLTAEEQEEAINEKASAGFVETQEYSERVIGKKLYQKEQAMAQGGAGTQWLPEAIPEGLQADIEKEFEGKSPEEIEAFIEDLGKKIEQGEETVFIGGGDKPYPTKTARTVAQKYQERHKAEAEKTKTEAEPKASSAPTILETLENLYQTEYVAKKQKRTASMLTEPVLPGSIITKLRDYQLEGFACQQRSWAAGMPGILNADEQGLGKTLQTIAFLRWLKDNAFACRRQRREEAEKAKAQRQKAEQQQGGAMAGPILIVAPTSLLENWQKEVKIHTAEGLGDLIPLYGAGVNKYRQSRGKETDNGETLLDFGEIGQNIEGGFGDRYWFLTTYDSLVNYQFSLSRIKFSAIVFDEIQALKNPGSLRACAARGMNADYRIGLTGTPIENAAVDLWAIMDVIAPGALGAKRDFQQRYSEPNADNMRELYDSVFTGKSALEPLAFRRLKRDAAKDLPKKQRFLYPQPMPNIQEAVYDAARIRAAQGKRSSALKILQHIRSVSVHPDLGMAGSDVDFIHASARLVACFDILREIRAKNERALVFIESRKMQHRFIELAQQEFGLSEIQHINGATAQRDRQKIVETFQKHLMYDGGFDLLVLGPRAAGTGLTLTAATHVIHLSRWWNPAVEEQCNDRVHRIGQQHDVSIHMPLAIHKQYLDKSFDCLLQNLMQRKRKLAETALWPMGDTAEDTNDLFAGLGSGQAESLSQDEDILDFAMRAMFDTEQSAGRKLSPHCYQID